MELCYDIATEGAKFNSFKEKINHVFEVAKKALRNAINAIRSIIAKFLHKTFGTNVIEINREHYNTVMNLIKKVESVEVSSIGKLKMMIGAATFDYDKMNSVHVDIANKLQDLIDLEENIKNVKPSNIGPTVTIRESYFTNMKNTFNSMYTQYSRELQSYEIIRSTILKSFESGKINDIDFGDHSLSEVVDILTSIVIRSSRINLLKTSLLISLVDLIINNRIKESDNTNEYVNGRYKNVKNTGKQNTNKNTTYDNDMKYITAKESFEAFVNFCNEMQIAEESLFKAKHIHDKGTKALNKNYEYIMDLPDSTEEEIRTKLNEIKYHREDIKDLIKQVRSEKPDFIDKLISGYAKIMHAGIKVVKTVEGFLVYAKLFSFNGFELKTFKRLGIILGASLLDDILKKGYTSNRKKVINSLVAELKKKDSKLSDLEVSLNNKLKAISK